MEGEGERKRQRKRERERGVARRERGIRERASARIYFLSSFSQSVSR